MMKKYLKYLMMLAVVVPVMFAATACGGKSTGVWPGGIPDGTYTVSAMVMGDIRVDRENIDTEETKEAVTDLATELMVNMMKEDTTIMTHLRSIPEYQQDCEELDLLEGDEYNVKFVELIDRLAEEYSESWILPMNMSDFIDSTAAQVLSIIESSFQDGVNKIVVNGNQMTVTRPKYDDNDEMQGTENVTSKYKLSDSQVIFENKEMAMEDGESVTYANSELIVSETDETIGMASMIFTRSLNF